MSNRLTPLSECARLGIGDTVQLTKGKILKIGDRVSGGTGDEAWVFQRLTLTDGRDEMTAKLWGHDAIPGNWRGKTVYLESGKKGRISMKEGDKKRGETPLVLNCSETVEVNIDEKSEEELSGKGSSDTRTNQPEKKHEEPKQPSQEKRPLTPEERKAEQEETMRKVKADVFRRSQLHAICLAAAHAEARFLEDEVGIKMSADQIASAASSIFISSDRDRLHYGLPATFIDLAPKVKDTPPQSSK